MNPKMYATLAAIPLVVTMKRGLDTIELEIFRFRRTARRFTRTLLGAQKLPISPYTMSILCVKRPAYVQMAILNINSLHFLNPGFKCQLYCDQVCFAYFMQHKSGLDYPDLVEGINAFPETSEPWQFYKLKTLIVISRAHGFLVDADSRWFSAPQLDPHTVTLLTRAYVAKDFAPEFEFLQRHYPKLGVKMVHFATGLIFIPAHFVTNQFVNDMWQVYESLSQLDSNQELARLRDEIAINVALARNVGSQHLAVLKSHDGPGNRHILQSYYYGCWNRITT